MRSKEVKYKGMRRIRKTRLCNRNAIKKRVTEHNVKKHNVLKQNVTNIKLQKCNKHNVTKGGYGA